MADLVPQPTHLPLPVNPFDPAYARVANINSAVDQAYAYNMRNALKYVAAAQTYNEAYRGAGGPPQNMTQPIPDLMRHVDLATGTQTDGPDPVVAPIPIPVVTFVPSSSSIVSNTPAFDRTDQILAGLSAIYDLLQKKLGA